MTDPFTLNDLAAIIASRAASSADKSYTKSLLDAGPARAAKKFGEEAVEALIAAVSQDDHALVAESADVLYHLLVVLQARNVALVDVMAELQRRTRQSGHAEKASRNPAGGGATAAGRAEESAATATASRGGDDG